ncbi:MAG: hypothetical protein GDA44_14750 [Prochloron sp. SP5CPC1]|nr:hypothetical protein [Candidatus Paraprochloron terpiosi SP5CPC1]
MNALERANSFNLTTKLATVVNLFKSEFPDAKADLKPWDNDADTRSLVDPDSLDIGFHFPGWSRQIQCRSVLVQIRFHEDSLDKKQRLIGVETAGFNLTGQVWRFSTVDRWECLGECKPAAEVREKLKSFCRQVFELFKGTTNKRR